MLWHKLIFGSYSRRLIAWAVNDAVWQSVRVSMIGESLDIKYNTLVTHLTNHRYSLKSMVQVTNYVNALKRGGLIK